MCKFVILILGFAIPGRTAQAQPLPAGWPNRIELGMADSPGGAAAMKRTAPFAFRYQYLAGGANTGSGWATWNTNGDFARFYIEDSVANGIIPVFTYYMLLQSSPGGGSESAANFTNLNNTATMTAYYNDLALFFQKAGVFAGQKVVLHVEPDLWGYMQQRSTNDDAKTVPAKVSETGIPLLAGLPSNVSGYARAIVKLRDTYAPNVILGYHISVWGTSIDIALSNPPDAQVDALGGRAAAFYNSLGATFDIVFAEFSDRDSGFYQYVYGDSGRSWWDAAARQHAHASAEQQHGTLPGQSSRMAAQRTRAHSSHGLSRCGRRRLPVWRWRRRCELRLRRAGRRRNQPGSRQREHDGVGACRRRCGADASRPWIHADARHPLRD
jgi:hypothetical protein